MMQNKKILVTQPFLPKLEEFIPYLEDIWVTKQLTNNGKYHQQLEKEIAEFLDVKYVSLFSNGTLALIAALQALRISGEVITTPYSFVATTHALWWNNIKPVFVDIEQEYCNIDTNKIEAAITPRTTAILPVHVYGNPCNIEKLKELSDIYGLKIIYDACHAFGVKYKGTSLLLHGDLSVLSFHATKIYNTFEGGAIISHDEKIKNRIDYLKNFGFVNETTVIAPGINAKMNELQAAFGIIQLKYVDENTNKRQQLDTLYRKLLADIPGIKTMPMHPHIEYNYPYFPIFIRKAEFGLSRDELYQKLRQSNIFVRRYFYPLISQFPIYRELESARIVNLPIADRISNSVICLPMYTDLENDQILKIVNIIKEK